eukprot:PLAT212.12.p2 GENE.PLAT212.12~~PLAT212.12.p2  ORF type:complete len:335 (-),score=168.74 PLAT212.12:34-1038(-)
MEDAAPGAPAPRVSAILCPGHNRPISELQYSAETPDGVFLISACLDKLPMLRNGETGDWVGTFEGHKGAVWSAKLNSTATQAATGSADFTASLWDALTGDLLHTWEEHRHIVKTVAFSNDDKRLLTGGKDKHLRIFSLGEPTQEAEVKMKFDSPVRKALFLASDDNLVMTGCDDGKLAVWDVRTSEAVWSTSLSGAVQDIEISRDASRITVAAGNVVSFFSAADFSLLKAHEMAIDVEAASLHPDGSQFVAGGTDLHVRLFDYESGEELRCRKGHHGPVHCLRFNPTGTMYTSGADDATIRIWRTEEAEKAAAAGDAVVAPEAGGGGEGGDAEA